MTLDYVKERILEIISSIKDDERAHSLEDKLHVDFIKAVAAGEIHLGELKAIAEEILRTEDLDFSRWCA